MHRYVILCSALLCTLLYSALLCFPPVCSPLLSSTLIYSSIRHHTILCICTLREPWAECPRILLQFSYNVHGEKQHKAECPRILQQLSYNLHRKNNTASCQRTPRMHPEDLKNPSQTTPQNTLKCIQNPPWEPPWNQTWKKLPNCAPKGATREPKGPKTGPQNH